MTAVKSSRNQQRKKDYYGKADKGSRNQDQLDAPVVGRLVEVKIDPETGRPCRPYTRVVHDGPVKTDGGIVAAPVKAKAEKRATDARKRRRQDAAWARCENLRGHRFNEPPKYRDSLRPILYQADRCASCGCPASAAASSSEG